jgi:hypothetical protein
MSVPHGLNSVEFEAGMMPEIDEQFGMVPDSPFEHTPERIVLSSLEHSHLRGEASLDSLGGAFRHARFGPGSLKLQRTSAPGEVRLTADVAAQPGPSIHLDARVRESWLTRTVGELAGAEPAVHLVDELLRLAEIPGQSTVLVRIEAD